MYGDTKTAKDRLSKGTKNQALDNKKYKTLMGTKTHIPPSKERQYHIDSTNRKGTKIK
jgi:hypothetical protein